jgi:DME family drug/metabolite transporter
MSVAATGAAVATAVTFGVAPVATGLAERIASGTRLSRRWVAGTVCAVLGCAVLVVPTGGVQVDLLALGALAGGCFGIYTVAAKHLIRHGAAMPAAVAVTLLVGGMLLAPWTLTALPDLATPHVLALVLWLGPVTAAAAYWFFVTGLRRVSAATAGTLSLVEPLVATALAVLVLGPSAPVAAGAVLLLGGLVIVSRQRASGDRGRNGRSSSGPFWMTSALDGGTSCHSPGSAVSGSETTTRASSPKWANR